ncbi:hypothetical protein [Halanaerobium kushneri]|uniref:Uncharacterized protein n=1 Tax=Halanaerobium kushneri TaxID=56779 RepID=A0A1N6PGX6_9FIRM|nr:hypothetical protein [Halanaerobium kushneri]SIQ03591.1 hypothetical protein SAMN05421834_10187 [Halanaerobium kushneri]
MEFYEKDKVRNWRNYNGCILGEKVWGRFQNNIFIPNHGGYEKGEFPVVWCNHDEKPCDVDLEELCVVRIDHEEE